MKNIGRKILVAKDLKDFWKKVKTHSACGFMIVLKE
jgi:hypothetical protein